MNKIIYAASLAAEVHAGQTRKWTGEPYLIHPIRVAGKVATLPGADEDEVAAAFLHDAFEETKDPSGLEKRIFDGNQLGSHVIRLMWELTSASKRTAGYKDKPREQRKAFDRQTLRDGTDSAKRIKLVDRTDNLRDIPVIDTKGNRPDPKFMKMYAEESLALLGAIEGINQVLEDELREAAQDLLWRVARFGA